MPGSGAHRPDPRKTAGQAEAEVSQQASSCCLRRYGPPPSSSSEISSALPLVPPAIPVHLLPWIFCLPSVVPRGGCIYTQGSATACTPWMPDPPAHVHPSPLGGSHPARLLHSSLLRLPQSRPTPLLAGLWVSARAILRDSEPPSGFSHGSPLL